MKTINLLLMFLVTFNLLAQNNYDKGFKAGFKKGYCYEQSYGCIAPTPPVTPTPRIGESYSSYTDGYNRGFEVGRNRQNNTKSNKSNSTSKVGNVSPSKYKSIDDNSYYRTVANNKAQAIYRTAMEYKESIDGVLKANVDSQLKSDILRAKYFLDKVFVNGVRLGDAETYLKKVRRIYNKAMRDYNKRVKH
jgi:hypothetical protein